MSSRAQLHRVCLAQIRAGNVAWVQALRDKALAKIAAGGGQIAPMTSASGNGKTFTREVSMDAVEVAEVTQAAIDEADGIAGASSTGFTVPDFSA